MPSQLLSVETLDYPEETSPVSSVFSSSILLKMS